MFRRGRYHASQCRTGEAKAAVKAQMAAKAAISCSKVPRLAVFPLGETAKRQHSDGVTDVEWEGPAAET